MTPNLDGAKTGPGPAAIFVVPREQDGTWDSRRLTNGPIPRKHTFRGYVAWNLSLAQSFDILKRGK